MLNVVRIMLRKGDIRLFKMKFLLPVIEKHFENLKDFNY